jgi:chromosome segregation ATPase
MSIKTSAKLKALQSRLHEAEAETDCLQSEFKNARSKLDKNLHLIKSLKTEISEIREKNKNVIVSEHAILRYLERIKGMNIEEIKKEMLDGKESQIKFAGSGKIGINGYTIVFKNNVVVSVTNNTSKG